MDLFGSGAFDTGGSGGEDKDVVRTLSLGDSDDEWAAHPEYSTPPRSAEGPPSPVNGEEPRPLSRPPTLTFDDNDSDSPPRRLSREMSNNSPCSPPPNGAPSPRKSALDASPRRALNFTRNESYLRLQGAPRTPRSLLQRAGGKPMDLAGKLAQRERERPSTAPELTVPGVRPANNNPFTPSLARSKRPCPPATATAHSATTSSIYAASPHKRRQQHTGREAVQGRENSNISRFHQEFETVCKLGAGEFGTVLKCKNRLDGTFYAIKRSLKPISGIADEQRLLKEVYAHAVVETQPYIVRYHSAWEEDNHMLIQNEYCDGGSLQDAIDARKQKGSAFEEKDLVRILKHVALGLRSLHSKRLAHLDIKPGNIFMKSETLPDTPRADSDSPTDSAANAENTFPPSFSPPAPLMEIAEDTAMDSNSNDNVFKSPANARDSFPSAKTQIVYKIGDLGHVTNIDTPSVEEGDTRYLAKEILAENYAHLPKSDIFSLGITIHELGSCHELPMNGEAWHTLRDGSPPHLPRYSANINSLIELMLHPDPKMRPTAMGVLGHPALVLQNKVPGLQKSKKQLYNELTAEKMEKRRIYLELQSLKQNGAKAFQSGFNSRPMLGQGPLGGLPRSRRNSAPAMRQGFRAASSQW